MGKINSSKKGSRNERRLAALFEKWIGVEVVRVPRSGGLQWKSGLMVTGDIIPADPAVLAEFPFSVETKFYNEITFQDLILPNKSIIQKFWDQASRDGVSVKKHPLVLFRYNRMPRDLYFIVMGFKPFIRIRSLMDLKEGWFNYSNQFVIFTSDNLFETPYPLIFKVLKNTTIAYLDI